MNDDPFLESDRQQRSVAPDEFASGQADTTQTDEGSQGHPMGGTKVGVGTGTTIGASRGNTGPGSGSDAIEEQYASKDFEGSTPQNYDDGGDPNTRGQAANRQEFDQRGLGGASTSGWAPSSVGGSSQDSSTLEDNYGTSMGSHGGGIGDTGAQRGSGPTAMGDTQGLGDDDTDAYKDE